jgi:hypothetical protein
LVEPLCGEIVTPPWFPQEVLCCIQSYYARCDAQCGDHIILIYQNGFIFNKIANKRKNIATRKHAIELVPSPAIESENTCGRRKSTPSKNESIARIVSAIIIDNGL